VIALIVQSIGGAKASLANNMVDANRGGHIALGDYPSISSLSPGKVDAQPRTLQAVSLSNLWVSWSICSSPWSSWFDTL
jgi:hypothetical protein